MLRWKLTHLLHTFIIWFSRKSCQEYFCRILWEITFFILWHKMTHLAEYIKIQTKTNRRCTSVRRTGDFSFYLPLLPKPPLPRSVSESSVASTRSISGSLQITIWAMRSPLWQVIFKKSFKKSSKKIVTLTWKSYIDDVTYG